MPPEDQPFGLGAGLEGWLETAARTRCAWVPVGGRDAVCPYPAAGTQRDDRLSLYCVDHGKFLASYLPTCFLRRRPASPVGRTEPPEDP